MTEKSLNDFHSAIETQKEILETNKNYGLGLMRLLLQVMIISHSSSFFQINFFYSKISFLVKMRTI